MAKTTTTTPDSDIAYFENMKMVVGGADVVRRHIIACVKDNIPFGLAGRAGIGKTEVVKQVAAELDMDLVIFYLQHKDKEDISGYPFPDPNDPKSVVMRLMKVIPQQRSKRKGTLLFMDEWNRADPAVVRAVFTMLNTPRMVSDFVLPDDVRIGLAGNMSGAGNYQVNDSEQDMAIRRRVCWIGMVANHAAFMKYAVAHKFHPTVISAIRRHKDWLYDNEGHNAGCIAANPASWETVSKIIYAREKDAPSGDLRQVEVELRTQIAGFLGKDVMGKFLNEVMSDEGIQLPSPAEICHPDFGPGHPAWNTLEQIVRANKAGANAKMGELASQVYDHVAVDQPSPAQVAPPLAKFATLLKGDTQLKFLDGLKDAILQHDTSTRYLDALTKALGDQKEYREVRKAMAQKATALENKISKVA